MTARRPLLTAAVAGSVLFALWCVPSANAFVADGGAAGAGPWSGSAERSGRSLQADRPGGAGSGTEGSGSGSAAADPAGTTGTRTGTAPRPLLADTGSPNTTPYAIGGAACLALGAGLVGFSVHRSRDETG